MEGDETRGGVYIKMGVVVVFEVVVEGQRLVGYGLYLDYSVGLDNCMNAWMNACMDAWMDAWMGA